MRVFSAQNSTLTWIPLLNFRRKHSRLSLVLESAPQTFFPRDSVVTFTSLVRPQLTGLFFVPSHTSLSKSDMPAPTFQNTSTPRS